MAAAPQPLTSVSLCGFTATVAEIKLPPANRPRLMEMGLLVGTPVELVRFAPMVIRSKSKCAVIISLCDGMRRKRDRIWVRIEDVR